MLKKRKEKKTKKMPQDDSCGGRAAGI